MVLSYDVSDDESTDDETESGGDYAERREGGDTESAEDAAWDDYRCNGVDTTDGCFFGNDKTKCGKVKSSTHIRRGWQNILKKLPRGNWPSKVSSYNEVDATDSCFFGKDKTKCGMVKSSTHIRRGWQNILKKLPRGNWPSKVRRYAVRNGIVSLDEILYNIAQHSNQCVLIIQPNFSR